MDAATEISTGATSAGATDTRQRLIEVAVALFTRYSFAGTSLQMIADELGVTKAAIYYHFRTREQLLSAVVAPVFDELLVIIPAAEAQRTAAARAEAMLSGYAELAVRNRALICVLAGDPSVTEALWAMPLWRGVIDKQVALLADLDPGPAGLMKATMVFAGIAGAVKPTLTGFEDAELNRELVEAGRRILGLRAPRRPVVRHT